MIMFFQFFVVFNVFNVSFYCLKLEIWLCLVGLEYQVKVVSDLCKVFKGKLFYVCIEGEVIGDSEIVICIFGECYGVIFDVGLDVWGKGWVWVIMCLCDEYLYYLMLYFCWFDEDSWCVFKLVFFGLLLFGVCDVVVWVMCCKVCVIFRVQGFGVYGRDELLVFVCDDFDVFDGLFGQVLYYGGEYLCSVDVVVYGIFVNFIEVILDILFSYVV